MENTVTITLAEWQRLDGLDRQFDERLKAAVKERIDSERAFVLRDRDEYVRRNEKLQDENQKLRDSVAESAGLNVKLRLALDEAEKLVDDLKKANEIARIAARTMRERLEKRDENEKTLRETVTRLREERCDLLVERDALLGRGFFSRLLNRRR